MLNSVQLDEDKGKYLSFYTLAFIAMFGWGTIRLASFLSISDLFVCFEKVFLLNMAKRFITLSECIKITPRQLHKRRQPCNTM